jgi:hypothetical protein
MKTPTLLQVDHLHISLAARKAATEWYETILRSGDRESTDRAGRGRDHEQLS